MATTSSPQLEENTKSGQKRKQSTGANSNAVTLYTLIGLLFFLILIISSVVIYFLKRHLLQRDMNEEIYSDIDAASIDAWRNFPQPNIRSRNLVPEISLAMQAIDNLCHGSSFTIATQASVDPRLQRGLAMRYDIDSSDTETSKDVYGSQTTDQSSDEEPEDTEVVDNAIYGSHLTLHAVDSSTSDGIEIEDNSIYGSHNSMQGIHGDRNGTHIIENEMYGSHMQFIDKDPITADGEASQDGPEGDATTDEIIPDPRIRREDVQENMPENTLDADKTNNPPVAEDATSDMCDDDEIVDNTYL